MKQLAKRWMLSFSRNARFQKLLEYNVTVSQYFMGIGSGDSTVRSGEQLLLTKLRSLSDKPLCIFDVGANKGQFLACYWRGYGVFHFTFMPLNQAAIPLTHSQPLIVLIPMLRSTIGG